MKSKVLHSYHCECKGYHSSVYFAVCPACGRLSERARRIKWVGDALISIAVIAAILAFAFIV